MAQMKDIIMPPNFIREMELQREKIQRQETQADKKAAKEKAKAEKKAAKEKAKAERKAAKEKAKAERKAAKEKAKAEKKAAKTKVAFNSTASETKTDMQTTKTFTEIPVTPAAEDNNMQQAASVLPIIAILGVCLFFVLRQRKTNREEVRM